MILKQAEEVHEDNIRWNSQMAGEDMIKSTRHQGSQEVYSFEFAVHKNMQ